MLGQKVFDGTHAVPHRARLPLPPRVGKRVVVVGGGAFAVENARNAIEKGAKQVVMVCRRRGTVMPLLLEYLNFARPYNSFFSHDRAGNALIFHQWRRAFHQCGVHEPECWGGGAQGSGRGGQVGGMDGGWEGE